MTRSRTRKTARTIAFLATSFLLTLFVAQAIASDETSSVGRGFGFAYDLASEITVVGTVQEFVSQAAPGSPAGLHLLISSSGTTIDAHLGPYFSSVNREALHAGQLVQIVGVNENVHGHNVLLARQLVFAGRLITVRNERGFLVHDRSPRRNTPDSKPAANGGAQ